MADGFIKKAYIALFDLLDKEYDKTSDNELGRLLSDMNPNTFVGDMSADSACYEDFCDFGKEYQKDDVLSAYSASMKFLKMYQDEFGFNIGKFVDTISFEKYKECFEKANIDKILIKVTLLNNFYSTRINDKDLVAVAQHIELLNIDEKLKSCDNKPNSELVHEIAYGEKAFNNIYSFASKYCAWHEPEFYPIVDKYTKGMLYKINEKLNLWDKIPKHNSNGWCKKITHKALNHYDVYCDLCFGVKQYIKDTYNLDLNLKQLDIFLWKCGKDIDVKSEESCYYKEHLKMSNK